MSSKLETLFFKKPIIYIVSVRNIITLNKGSEQYAKENIIFENQIHDYRQHGRNS